MPPTKRAKNQQAIIDWCRANRPDCASDVEKIVDGAGGDGPILLMTLAFEAGRKFQTENPTMPLRSGSHYLPD
jgi:hypothetical protein